MRALLTGGSGFIGTHLARALRRDGAEVMLLDVAAPSADLRPFWNDTDVLDEAGLARAMDEFGPSHIIHLAAETEASTTAFPPDPRFFTDFPVNLRGTRNVLHAATRCAPERLIVFSSSFIQGFASDPSDMTPPHTPYGHSKLMMEALVATSELPWVILRPTYVWGSGNERFLRLADALARRLYLHPTGRPVVRSYASVTGVVEQTKRALTEPRAVGAALFIGDEPMDSGRFVDALSMELVGRPARRVPRRLLSVLATLLDPVPKVPLDRFRYRHMTNDFVVDMQPTWEVLGRPSTTFDASVRAFGAWYRTHRSGEGSRS